MLPEFILREERNGSYFLLFLLGFLSTAVGFKTASIIFPSEADLITVFLAAIPIVYPLTKFFLEDEKEGSPHTPEIATYCSIFAGQVLAFSALGYVTPESFQLQISVFRTQLTGMGITGYAIVNATFQRVLLNNLVVFGFILAISALIGSAGAFIISWNASVFGVFLGILTREIPGDMIDVIFGSGSIPSPIAYIPHATFELTGFIIAGISGSMMSAAVYREHLDRRTWENLLWMTLMGFGFIFIGAGIETGRPIITFLSLAITLVFVYLTAKTTEEIDPEERSTKLLKDFSPKQFLS